MARTRRAFSLPELLVAMSLFILVSGVCFLLLRATLSSFVWGSKRMDMLRQNREITKRLGPIIRGAAAANPGADPVISCTAVNMPPVPNGHLEELVMSVPSEHRARLLRQPVPVYPAPPAFNPRASDQVPLFGQVRLFWNATNRMLALDGNTPLDATDDVIVARNVQLIDFIEQAADRSVQVTITTRSLDPNSRIDGRDFTTRMVVHIPNWL